MNIYLKGQLANSPHAYSCNNPFKDEGYFPYLLEQAGHQSWWIRREVQHAIQYYSNWQEKYIEIALHHPDRFARESALEALARKDVTTYALS